MYYLYQKNICAMFFWTFSIICNLLNPNQILNDYKVQKANLKKKSIPAGRCPTGAAVLPACLRFAYLLASWPRSLASYSLQLQGGYLGRLAGSQASGLVLKN